MGEGSDPGRTSDPKKPSPKEKSGHQSLGQWEDVSGGQDAGKAEGKKALKPPDICAQWPTGCTPWLNPNTNAPKSTNGLNWKSGANVLGCRFTLAGFCLFTDQASSGKSGGSRGRWAGASDEALEVLQRLLAQALRGGRQEADDVLETWANRRTLADHYADHGADFAAKSEEDYAAQAARFYERNLVERFPTKVDDDGVIRVWDPGTNTFGSYNSEGLTKTFYKPDSLRFWSTQEGASPWVP